jgi:hypothetical protein
MNTAYIPLQVRQNRLQHVARSCATATERAPLRYVFIACIALAAVSYGALPSALGYDPWAWTVWGRELMHLNLSTAGGPAFKPLPVAVAAMFSLTGHPGVAAWLIASRTAALFAPVLAFRLGARLGGRLAGAMSAGLLTLMLLIVFGTTVEGYVEPALIVLVLLAVDRHFAGHPAQAFLLGAAAALGRPEVWPFLVVYAALNWRQHPRMRPLLVLTVVLIPVCWLAPDWLVSNGNATRGAAAAPHKPLEVLEQTAALIDGGGVIALVIAAFIAVRSRNRALLTLIGAGLVGIAGVAVLGTPQVRYVMLPAAVLCLPAGVGAAAVARAVVTPRARVLLAVCVIAALRLPMVGVQNATKDQSGFVDKYADLPTAIARAGGASRLLGVGQPIINPQFHAALAWRLHVPLDRVQRSYAGMKDIKWNLPAVVFRTAESLETGPLPRFTVQRVKLRVLARTREWTVLLAEPQPRPLPQPQPAG